MPSPAKAGEEMQQHAYIQPFQADQQRELLIGVTEIPFFRFERICTRLERVKIIPTPCRSNCEARELAHALVLVHPENGSEDLVTIPP